MKTKEQIVNETCLAYVVKHLPKEIDRYYNLGDNHPCEGVQWRLVTHMICVYETLTTFGVEAHSEDCDKHKKLCEMIDKFEKEN